MSGVWNPVLETSQYKSGFFVRIPSRGAGVSALLENTVTGDILLVDHTVSTRQIARGKYDRLIRVDTRERTLGVAICATAAEENCQYNIAMQVRVQVSDPVRVYQDALTDVASAIGERVYPTVKAVAADYSVLGRVRELDEELMRECAALHGADIFGLAYRFLSIAASLDATGAAYRKRIHEAKLEETARLSEMKSRQTIQERKLGHARALGESLDPVSAILSQVMDGTIGLREAQARIDEMKREQVDQRFANVAKVVDAIEKIRGVDLLSDRELRAMLLGRLQDELKVPAIGAGGAQEEGFPSDENLPPMDDDAV